ncbi:cuticle protein 64-like [Chrysoperla carnea]|uniref:cuticle protein 64-like n=1 Tax=Chrysoperla carnea TaxID=189513 RepID=UPI001D05CB2E|nr:cuticle protein 64-like [Chrysoperla carnea]
MFKLTFLLSCVVAITVADPGYLGGAYGLGNGYGYGGYGYGGHGYAAIPAAVSHQSNVAIHSKPIITAPVIIKPQLIAAIPAATSHQSRVDLISKPIVSYAAPHLSYGSSYVATSPIVSGLYGNGYNGLSGYSSAYGLGYGYGNNYYGSHY